MRKVLLALGLVVVALALFQVPAQSSACEPPPCPAPGK